MEETYNHQNCSRYSRRLRSRPLFMERDIVAGGYYAAPLRRIRGEEILESQGCLGRRFVAGAGAGADITSMVNCRREQLLGEDVSFLATLFIVIVVVVLFAMFLLWSMGG